MKDAPKNVRIINIGVPNYHARPNHYILFFLAEATVANYLQFRATGLFQWKGQVELDHS